MAPCKGAGSPARRPERGSLESLAGRRPRGSDLDESWRLRVDLCRRSRCGRSSLAEPLQTCTDRGTLQVGLLIKRRAGSSKCRQSVGLEGSSLAKLSTDPTPAPKFGAGRARPLVLQRTPGAEPTVAAKSSALVGRPSVVGPRSIIGRASADPRSADPIMDWARGASSWVGRGRDRDELSGQLRPDLGAGLGQV